MGGMLWSQAALVAVAAVSNPEKDFLRNYASDRKENLIRTEVDLNGDTVPEILFSLTSMVNGRQGNIWVIYRSLPGGNYERIDELTGGGVLEFHQKATAIQNRGSSGRRLLRFSPAGSGRGMLISYELDANGLGETVLDPEIAPLGADAATYTNLFEDPNTRLVYHFENAGKLRDRYFPLQKYLEKMNFIRWCLFAVGVLLALLLLVGVFRMIVGMIQMMRN